MYDPMLGRTPTLDSNAEEYYSISPYVWCAGNPSWFVDLNGQKIVLADGSSRQFHQNFKSTQEYLNEHNVGDLLAKLDKLEEIIIVSESDNKSSFDPKTNILSWNPTGGVLTDLGVELSPATVLNHESDHALQEFINPKKKKQDKATLNAQFDNEEEHRVIDGSERRTAEALGEIKPGQKTRTTHTGQEYKTLGPTTTMRDYSVKYATDLDEIEIIVEGKRRLSK